MKSNERKSTNVTFYYFSKSSIPPRRLSTKLQWQEIYTNFKILRSNHPRTPLKEVSGNKEKKKVYNQDLPVKRKSIVDEIGDYFNSPEALQLFNPRSD